MPILGFSMNVRFNNAVFPGAGSNEYEFKVKWMNIY